MHSQGFVLDDLYADFVTRFRRIHRAHDRGELSDGKFEKQANLFVQEYLQDRMMGAEIGMIRDSYLVRLADLSYKYDGEELRENAYSALREQLNDKS